MNIVEELAEIARTWPEKLRNEKEKGTKIVGYTGRFIPEELIYASGAMPYLICKGGEPEPPEAALSYMVKFSSPLARAQVGYYLLDMDPVIPMCDLIAAQCSDCHDGGLADILEYLKLPVLKVGVPQDWEKSLARDYYYRVLARLKDRLEVLTGNKISDEKLTESIASINRIRDVLRKISLLRKEQPPPIGGYDFIRLNHYSFYCDLDYQAKRLNDLYQQLKQGESPFSKRAPRILLAGHVVSVGDYVVPKLIEDSGGVTVAQFLDEGIRHYLWDVKTGGDLMKNLGETYYLNRVPASIFQPAWLKRVEYIRKLIKDFAIDGVIWYQLFMEDTYDLEGPIVAKAMEEVGIPFLKLESSFEYSRESTGPLRTRVESFIESIKRKRS